MQYPGEKAAHGNKVEGYGTFFEAVQNSQHVFYHKALNGCLCTCET